MEKLIGFLERYPKLFVVVFFFLWGGFLILFSLHKHIFPQTLYLLAVNGLVVGQLYLGFRKKDGKRNSLGVLLGILTGVYTLMINVIALTS